jgi:hypothetical protein
LRGAQLMVGIEDWKDGVALGYLRKSTENTNLYVSLLYNFNRKSRRYRVLVS